MAAECVCSNGSRSSGSNTYTIPAAVVEWRKTFESAKYRPTVLGKIPIGGVRLVVWPLMRLARGTFTKPVRRAALSDSGAMRECERNHNKMGIIRRL